ncbi:ABC transporter substrate-binding protein [Geodermatophilus sp. SYSU D00698]
MRRHVAALLAVPVLFLAACGGAEPSASASGGSADGGPTPVTVGVVPIVDVAPIYLGVQQGFFEEEGIDLTLETAQGGAAIVPAVLNQEYQFGFSNMTSLLTAASQGLPLEVVVAGAASTGEQGADYSAVLTRPDSGITDAADLAGRTVAVNTLGNIGTTTINVSVRAAGGDPATINYVELPFSEMPAALEQGDVDAIWGTEPFLTIGTRAGAVVVASNFVDAADDLTVAGYFTSRPFAAENADVVERFTAAMERSLEYASANPEAARAVLSEYTEIDQAVIDTMVLPAWGPEVNRESVERLAELGVQDGLLDDAPDLDALLP